MLNNRAFEDTWFDYKGERYITTKTLFNEVFRLIFNKEFYTLELLIECSDDIRKLDYKLEALL